MHSNLKGNFSKGLRFDMWWEVFVLLEIMQLIGGQVIIFVLPEIKLRMLYIVRKTAR